LNVNQEHALIRKKLIKIVRAYLDVSPETANCIVREDQFSFHFLQERVQCLFEMSTAKRPMIFASKAQPEIKKIKTQSIAIPWITVENGVWSVHAEATAFLEKLTGSVSVLSVGGR